MQCSLCFFPSFRGPFCWEPLGGNTQKGWPYSSSLDQKPVIRCHCLFDPFCLLNILLLLLSILLILLLYNILIITYYYHCYYYYLWCFCWFNVFPMISWSWSLCWWGEASKPQDRGGGGFPGVSSTRKCFFFWGGEVFLFFLFFFFGGGGFFCGLLYYVFFSVNIVLLFVVVSSVFRVNELSCVLFFISPIFWKE